MNSFPQLGLNFFLIGLLLITPSFLTAEPKRLVKLKTDSSAEVPLSFRTDNLLELSSRLLQLEKALDQLRSLLGLEKIKDSRFLVVWIDDEQLGKEPLWLDSFPRTVSREGGQWVFTITAQGNWNQDIELVYRSLAISFLQAQILAKSDHLKGDTLPEPPLWLSEGLTQLLLNQRREDLAAVVWRYHLANKIPSLDTIQTWPELSELSLRRSWQQAFSFWLVIQSTKTTSDRKTMLNYLAELYEKPDKLYWIETPVNIDWWQRSTSLALKKPIPQYDWDQSSGRLREATFFNVTYVGDKDERIISIIELPKSVQSLKSLDPIKESIKNLSRLQSIGHPLIAPVAESYAQALAAWLAGDIDGYSSGLKKGRNQQLKSIELRQEANDFLDWFTVNYALDINTPDYRNYAELAESLEAERDQFRKKQ